MLSVHKLNETNKHKLNTMAIGFHKKAKRVAMFNQLNKL